MKEFKRFRFALARVSITDPIRSHSWRRTNKAITIVKKTLAVGMTTSLPQETIYRAIWVCKLCSSECYECSGEIFELDSEIDTCDNALMKRVLK